jgi:hypothetical protein
MSAYSAYRREGNLLAAARAARTLGWFHGSAYGEWAVYRGWIGRAVNLLEQAGANSNEHGWVLLAQAQAGSDLDDQKWLYLRVIETARRCGDADLECDALASLGIMLAFSGYASSPRRPSSTTSAGSSPSSDCPAEPEPSRTPSHPRTRPSGRK